MGGRRAGKAAPFGLRGLAAASADVSGSAREAADARGPCIVRERPRTGGLRPTRDRLRLDGWPGLRRLDSTVVRERTVIRMSPAPPHHLPWRAREDQAPLTHAHGGSRRKTAKASGGGRRGPVVGGTGHFAPYRASRGSDGQADEMRINRAKASPLDALQPWLSPPLCLTTTTVCASRDSPTVSLSLFTLFTRLARLALTI